MKIKEATDILKSIGWQLSKDEVGDRFAQMQLKDRTVEIGYIIRRFLHDEEFSASPALYTDEFSSTYNHIRDRSSGRTAFIVPWNWHGVRVPEIREEHVHQASQMAIDWAKEQDLHQGLLAHAALPTTAFGTRPVKHLAALALLGDIEKLKFYQASFEAGDRLGFEDYITKDYIDRAVAIAEQHLTAD